MTKYLPNQTRQNNTICLCGFFLFAAPAPRYIVRAVQAGKPMTARSDGSSRKPATAKAAAGFYAFTVGYALGSGLTLFWDGAVLAGVVGPRKRVISEEVAALKAASSSLINSPKSSGGGVVLGSGTDALPFFCFSSYPDVAYGGFYAPWQKRLAAPAKPCKPVDSLYLQILKLNNIIGQAISAGKLVVQMTLCATQKNPPRRRLRRVFCFLYLVYCAARLRSHMANYVKASQVAG